MDSVHKFSSSKSEQLIDSPSDFMVALSSKLNLKEDGKYIHANINSTGFNDILKSIPTSLSIGNIQPSDNSLLVYFVSVGSSRLKIIDNGMRSVILGKKWSIGMLP